MAEIVGETSESNAQPVVGQQQLPFHSLVMILGNI